MDGTPLCEIGTLYVCVHVCVHVQTLHTVLPSCVRPLGCRNTVESIDQVLCLSSCFGMLEEDCTSKGK